MFVDLSVRKKLYGGFAAVIAILLVLLAAFYSNFAKLTEAIIWDRHTLEVLLAVDGLEADIIDVQSGYRGFLLTGNTLFVTRLKKKESDIEHHFQEIKKLTADNADQQAAIHRIETLTVQWFQNTVDPLIAQRTELGKAPGAADQIANTPMMAKGFETVETLRTLLDTFSKTEKTLLEERARLAESLQQSMRMLLIFGGLVCVLAAMAIAMLLARAILRPLGSLTSTVSQIAAGQQAARVEVLGRDELGQVATEFNRMAQSIEDSQRRELETTNELKRKVDSLLEVVVRAKAGDLTGNITVTGNDAIGQLGNGLVTMFGNLRELLYRVQKAGIQVATSTTEIAAASKQQEVTGIEQAQTSIEVLSTTKEISANTAQLLKAMEEVTQVAEDTTTASTEAQSNLKRMDHTMQRMVSATDSINAKLATLSEKASNINNVLTTITKVADQTNILSLNAAIEAEKAGEAGRGFSVVATEIRRLSDQTAVATWDIEQMLKEMQSAVSASVMGMDKFTEEIRRSVDETQQVADGLKDVIEQVQKLTPRFDLVFEGMQSQAVGASQITETMMQLNEATQQAVDALKASSEAVQQLQYAAHDLQTGVSSFAVTL